MAAVSVQCVVVDRYNVNISCPILIGDIGLQRIRPLLVQRHDHAWMIKHENAE